MTTRCLKVFVPFAAITIVVSLFCACQQVQDSPTHYYLTTNNQLLEYSYLSTRIYHQKGKPGKIDPGFFYADTLLEKDQYLYVTAFYRNSRRSRILRINPDKNKFDTLYRLEGKNRLGRNVYAYKDTIACIEKNYSIGERFLVLLQPEKKVFKKVKATGKLERKHYYSVVFGADEVNGKRFWLIYIGFYPQWSILKVWEEGRIEKLGMSEMVPVYINGNLITGDEQMIVFNRIKAVGLEKIKALPAEKGLVFHQGGGRNLDQHPSEELYGVIKENMGSNKWRRALRLDLKALELTEVKSLENGIGSFHYCHPDTWYYSHSEYNSGEGKCILKGLYQFKHGKLGLIKKFESIDLDIKGNYFKVYDTGFVLKKDGKVSVYSLPDLIPIILEK
jgi:hypothetical protein